jgi:3-hydroxybutyryl-CoA dehydrogenase
MIMERSEIGIIGSGTMGIGITQLAATAGHRVVLYDLNSDALKKAQTQLQIQINKLEEKGKLNASDAVALMGRIYFVEKKEALSDCKLIIEAIIENIQIKKSLFADLEHIVSTDCILASNTSSLSITGLASACKQPDRFIGLHFFNPVPIMQLVEIIPALQTDVVHIETLRKLVESWGKISVVAKDTPGFIVNRIARTYYSEALRIYEEGFADFATIDYAMTSVYGFKMGPFALMDFIGNDVNYAVTQSVWESCYYEARYKPSVIQRNLVAANWLGKKSGRGYYNYESELPQADKSNEQLIGDIGWRILVMLINEAVDAYYFGIASKEDIELAMTRGVNYPKGLLQWAKESGYDHCIETMNRLFHNYHEERYRCSEGFRKLKSES